MENKILNSYFKELRKLDDVDGNDQIELVIKAKAGDKEAFKQIVECNLKFVISIAKEYLYSGFPLEDLINEGNYGLIKSIDKFDETRGIRFISYAVWWIRQSILQFIYENGGAVRLPINRINIKNKVNRAKEKLYHDLNREPTIDEISQETSVCTKDVKISVNDCSSSSSKLESDSDEELSMIDLIEGDGFEKFEKYIDKKDVSSELESVLNSLNPRESKILRMYFGIGFDSEMTLREIGERMDLTNERVRQIKEFALKKLRTYNKSSKLKELLEYKL